MALTTFQRLVSGAVAGAVARTITCPLDVVKTVMQCAAKGESVAIGTFVKDLLARDGIMGLWRGNGVALIRTCPYTAIKFYANTTYRKFVTDRGEMTHLKSLIAGSLAGCTAVACTYPLDVVKTRLTIDDPVNPKYSGMMDCMVKTTFEEGPFALFKGLSTTFAGVIPYEGGQFFARDFIKTEWTNAVGRPLNFTENFLSGCAAGAFAQTISYPFDSVRKRMQADKTGKYKSMGDCFVKMFTNEGVSSFFKGAGINLIKMVPSSAITFSAKDMMDNFFTELNERREAEAKLAGMKK